MCVFSSLNTESSLCLLYLSRVSTPSQGTLYSYSSKSIDQKICKPLTDSPKWLQNKQKGHWQYVAHILLTETSFISLNFLIGIIHLSLSFVENRKLSGFV